MIRRTPPNPIPASSSQANPGTSTRANMRSKLAQIGAFTSRALNRIACRASAANTAPMNQAAQANGMMSAGISPTSPPASRTQELTSLRSTPGQSPGNVYIAPENLVSTPQNPFFAPQTAPPNAAGMNQAETASFSDFDDELPRILTWEEDFNTLCEEIFPEKQASKMSDQSQLPADIEEKVFNLIKERCDLNDETPQPLESSRTIKNAKKMAVILLNGKESKLSPLRAPIADAAEHSFMNAAPRTLFDPSKVKDKAQSQSQSKVPYQFLAIQAQRDTSDSLYIQAQAQYESMQVRFDTIGKFFNIALPNASS